MDVFRNRDIYRNTINTKDLVFYRAIYKETDLLIGSEENHKECIEKRVVNTRKILDEHIENNHLFYESLAPIGYNVDAQKIIKKMCIASKKAGVGPMAAVAGAFCSEAFDEIADIAQEVIIENGGDLLIRSKKQRTIALFAGKSPLSMKLGLKIKPSITPTGICTSAGTIGHSKSFGNADMALVISKDVLLADACATKLGNLIITDGDLKKATEQIYSIEGIIGAVAIIKENIAAVGDLDIVPIE